MRETPSVNLKTCFSDHPQCANCKETPSEAFRYIESRAGEKFQFESSSHYMIVFILTGEAKISCNEFKDVLFKAGEMCLFPSDADCSWETVRDASGITFTSDRSHNPCDRASLNQYSEHWFNVEPALYGLSIRPRLMDFLTSVKHYLQDGITCHHLDMIKRYELSLLLRAYYSLEELSEFFMDTVKNTHEFEDLIMQNYLKMKGVKEFVNLSGLNVSTFNRKFKKHFGMSPYQWMIKQKSKHIKEALGSNDKSIASIMREFDFADASHFNRYCKAMFGASPSELREQFKSKP